MAKDSMRFSGTVKPSLTLRARHATAQFLRNAGAQDRISMSKHVRAEVLTEKCLRWLRILIQLSKQAHICRFIILARLTLLMKCAYRDRKHKCRKHPLVVYLVRIQLPPHTKRVYSSSHSPRPRSFKQWKQYRSSSWPISSHDLATCLQWLHQLLYIWP